MKSAITTKSDHASSVRPSYHGVYLSGIAQTGFWTPSLYFTVFAFATKSESRESESNTITVVGIVIVVSTVVVDIVEIVAVVGISRTEPPPSIGAV